MSEQSGAADHPSSTKSIHSHRDLFRRGQLGQEEEQFGGRYLLKTHRFLRRSSNGGCGNLAKREYPHTWYSPTRPSQEFRNCARETLPPCYRFPASALRKAPCTGSMSWRWLPNTPRNEQCGLGGVAIFLRETNNESGDTRVLGFSLVMWPSEIRTLRTRHGWTQKELADRLGTDAVTVSRWERGKSQPRPSAEIRLRDLASGLPSDIQALVGFVGASRARTLLKRASLLSVRPPEHRFSADPARRIKEVGRALEEQRELKARARVKR